MVWVGDYFPTTAPKLPRLDVWESELTLKADKDPSFTIGERVRFIDNLDMVGTVSSFQFNKKVDVVMIRGNELITETVPITMIEKV